MDIPKRPPPISSIPMGPPMRPPPFSNIPVRPPSCSSGLMGPPKRPPPCSSVLMGPPKRPPPFSKIPKRPPPSSSIPKRPPPSSSIPMRPRQFSNPDLAKITFIMLDVTNKFKLSCYEDELINVLRDYLHIYIKSVLSAMAEQKKLYAIKGIPCLTLKLKDEGDPPPQGSSSSPECEKKCLNPWQASMNWPVLCEEDITTLNDRTELERERARNKKMLQKKTRQLKRLKADNIDEEDKDDDDIDKKEASSCFVSEYVIPKLTYTGPVNDTTTIYSASDLIMLIKRNWFVIPNKRVQCVFMQRIENKLKRKQNSDDKFIELKMKPSPDDIKI